MASSSYMPPCSPRCYAEAQTRRPTVLSHANHRTTPSAPKPPHSPGGAAAVASKSVPTFVRLIVTYFKAQERKQSLFICTLGPYCQTPADCSVAISSCFDLGGSGVGGGTCLQSACRGSGAKLLRGLRRPDLSEVRSFYKATVISGR